MFYCKMLLLPIIQRIGLSSEQLSQQHDAWYLWWSNSSWEVIHETLLERTTDDKTFWKYSDRLWADMSSTLLGWSWRAWCHSAEGRSVEIGRVTWVCVCVCVCDWSVVAGDLLWRVEWGRGWHGLAASWANTLTQTLSHTHSQGSETLQIETSPPGSLLSSLLFGLLRFRSPKEFLDCLDCFQTSKIWDVWEMLAGWVGSGSD